MSKGLECYNCTSVAEYQSAEDNDECPACGSEDTMVVDIEPCSADNCTDDNHHFGISKHVIEIDR